MEIPPPPYANLQKASSGHRTSWSYFNSLPSKHSSKDQLGTLNFLTPDRRLAAKNEIQSGISISLELPADHFSDVTAAFNNRPVPKHTVKQVAPFSYEDELSFNTQSSSQWDGLRHFGFLETQEYYNGYKSAEFESNTVLSIHSWLEAGGIVGRGILLDFASWAESTGKEVDVNDGYAITLEDIMAILAYQKTSVRPGDILIFRTGWLRWFNSTSTEARHHELCVNNAPGKHRFVGLQSSPEFAEWLWHNQIAAVAGDQVAFESTPPPPEGGFGWLHEHLIAGLGMPLGELWDTERLAEQCKKANRWTFFFTSSPLCVKGGVASTCNALAIL